MQICTGVQYKILPRRSDHTEVNSADLITGCVALVIISHPIRVTFYLTSFYLIEFPLFFFNLFLVFTCNNFLNADIELRESQFTLQAALLYLNRIQFKNLFFYCLKYLLAPSTFWWKESNIRVLQFWSVWALCVPIFLEITRISFSLKASWR